jgi:hypothetical protein
MRNLKTVLHKQRAFLVSFLVVSFVLAFSAPSALANSAWWKVTSNLAPARLSAGSGREAKVRVTVVNAGDAAVNANTCVKVASGSGKYKDAACTEAAAPGEEEFEDKSTVKITDTLPAGMEVTGVYSPPGQSAEEAEASCNTEHLPSTSVTCEWTGDRENFEGLKVHDPLQPFERIELQLTVVTPAVRTNVPGEVVVTGGEDYECKRVAPGEGDSRGVFCREQEAGAGEFEGEFTNKGVPRVSLVQTVPAEGEETPFGVEHFEMIAENEGGAVDTQAGSHPFQLTTSFAFNQTHNASKPPASLKDVIVKLPPGLIGNANALGAQCTAAQFAEEFASSPANGCSPQTAVGVAVVRVLPGEEFGEEALTREVPIFNLQPDQGEPASFGFEAEHIPVIIGTSVRTGEDYGVTTASTDITQAANVVSTTLVFWGVPGDPRHDLARGWNCVGGGYYSFSDELPACQATGGASPPPFLMLPTSCTGPLQASIEADSWGNGNQQPSVSAEPVSYLMPGVGGCNQLPFSASLEAAPDVQSASTSSGLAVKIHVPQEADVAAGNLASADVKTTTVALPEGVALNPSGGDGLEACSESEVGYLPPPQSTPPGDLHFTSTLLGPGHERELLQPGLNLGANGFCASASKIATVRIKTPDLPNELKGSVYLAAQNANPFGSLVAMYLVAEDPVSGTLVKLAGVVHLGATGQIVATFENTPQLPFEEIELHFFGGERAPLATPAHCGDYTTQAAFTPWSAEADDEAAVTDHVSSSFEINSGPNHSRCVYEGEPLPFAPSLHASSSSVQAGGLTPLSTTISREDGQQNMSQVTLHFPPGLSGLLSSVKLCGEQQANEGKCGPESEIGETIVSAGVGSDPVSVMGGKVYITEKYHGAPFGLSIVNPVKAGPFDLEHDTSNPNQDPACDCVVVRAKIEVNPTTAALSVTTNSESEGYAIPHLIDGIPVQIQHVNVNIDRPGFTFNPTSCNPMSITGSIGSDEGASSPVSVPFQVTNCASLKFEPKVAVSTSGKTSKADGASLSLKLTKPDTQSVQADIAKFKVELPKSLPSRLTTLQRACTAKAFAANPASCPTESVVGHMKVLTPLLPVPLEGPMYFVSNGGEAFPNLIVVLQGYGVTIDLVGDTFISKSGVTSSTFKALPDAPFSSAEVTLPEGKYSALAANGNLCQEASKLKIPTELIAQSGTPIYQTNSISVAGCAKSLTRAQKLKAALASCRKKDKRHKHKREACEKAARKKYGVVKKVKKRK